MFLLRSTDLDANVSGTKIFDLIDIHDAYVCLMTSIYKVRITQLKPHLLVRIAH